MNSSTPTIHDRLTDLTPRMLTYARAIPPGELEPDDLYQEMALAIVERSQKDPRFLEQQDAYVTQFGTWRAKHAAERGYRQAARTTPLEDGEADMYCLVSDPSEDPEEAAEQAEALDELVEMVLELTPENQSVVKLIYLGYSESEIATRLHISRPAVSQRKRTIARLLAARGAHA